METELANNIKTPVWKGPLLFHTGGITKFWGPMECSKTRAMIALLFYLIEYQKFENTRVFSNCWIDMPGSHWLRNDELRKILRRAFNTETGAGKWSKCIFLIMDADDIYSHITQVDKECYQDLKKASQAYKRNIHLFYEVHEGLSVPKYMRDKTEISIRPVPHESLDNIDLFFADGHYNKNYKITIENISSVNAKYRRFDENY